MDYGERVCDLIGESNELARHLNASTGRGLEKTQQKLIQETCEATVEHDWRRENGHEMNINKNLYICTFQAWDI